MAFDENEVELVGEAGVFLFIYLFIILFYHAMGLGPHEALHFE